MRRIEQHCTVTLTREEFSLLRELDFPCTEQILNGARTTRYGYELSGSVADFEYLVGWVAGEANHSPEGSGRGLMLDDIAESIEAGRSSAPG